ncbi:MAG TPA: translocation/assembly module TamB domain-containing protein [Flavisolibacter sp.]|nr:translocation/assembly module TamB domain-containing protein [Flavisolibacter sp.]
MWIFLQTDFGQNWLAQKVTGKLSKDLQTKISIKHVSIGFFNRMELQGVYVEDQTKDTLLYAGAVNVRITDWFFFKDKADLKYIGLDNAVIHLNRTDSIWNYAFLAAYFASSDTVTVKKKDAGIQFSLQKVVINNVTFLQKDAWLGTDLTVKVGALNLNADEISASKKLVQIKNIDLTDPYFSSLSYPGKAVDTSSSPMDWSIRFNNIKIKNGRFRQDKGNYMATVPYFDGAHIDFSNINASFDGFKFQRDSLTGNLDLSATERSGFAVKKLKAALTIHPKAFVFDKLFLQTNRSTLADHFALSFPSTKSLADFVHAVTLNANFKQSFISSEDLAFFIPDAGTWKKNIKINGLVEGTIDGLASENLELWLGNKTYINGNISVVGLPDINKTLLNIEAKALRTTYTDAVGFFPALSRLSTPNLKALSYVNFKGSFTGFVNDFVAYGTIQTALGTLTTDLNMKLPKSGEPVYAGTISTDGFQVGTLIKNKQLGIVDFHGSVKGRSFDWNKINVDIDGVIHRIQWDHYTYQNIKGKGAISRQLFNGDFTINDPNADLHLNGLIDFSKALPVFDATAQIRTANLKALQLTKEDIKLQGDFNLNLQGNSLTNLMGTARISNAELVANGQKLSFDYLNVASYYINNERSLSLSSNEFDGKITGNFDLATLPSAFRLFLSRYYPAYIKPPTFYTPQDFSFDITTGLVEDYLKLVDKNLSGLNNSHLTGSLNTGANSMTIDADVPAFAYGLYAFTDVKLRGTGNLDSLILTGSASDATLGSGIVLPETTFSIRAGNDVSDIVLNTTSNQAINEASLAARLKTYSDGIAIAFSPSSFMLNGKAWTIEQGGELNLRKNAVANGQLVLREGVQEINIKTVASDYGTWNDLHVTLQNLNLGDLSPLLMKANRLEGRLTGEIVIENPTEKLLINADLKGSAIQLDNDSLGNVAINGRYDNISGMLTAKGANVDPEHKIEFDVAMNLADSANVFQDKISLRPTNFSLKVLERFLGTLFTNIQGYTTGNADLLLEGGNLDLTGKLSLHDARLRVVFTQVDYKITDTEIEFKKGYLDLNGITLRDMKGNTAKITGGIKHEGFKNMDFDLAVQTVSPQMELINTTFKDNQQFFGHAWGSGSFVLIGPQYDMNMFIDVKASTTDSSNITLPPAQTRESGLSTFLVEKKYGREMTETEKRGGESNINFEVNLTATPLVNVELILDELTGDIIRGRGNGNLKITSGTLAPLRLSGRYNIEEGAYNFTFQSVFKRPFIVRKGANNYVEWNGDPYDANINLEAYYTAENVSFAPLASSLIVDADAARSLARLRDNVNVAAKLTGKLFSPKLDFKLEFPSNSLIYTQPSIAFAIQQLERNTNELTKQVTFLVVTNSFAPYESTQAVARPFEELAYNTISGVLFNVINQQLNQIFSKILRNNNFTLNFSGSLYNRNLLDPNAKGVRLFNQASSNLSLGTSFFSGRAILTVGGSFDVPLETNIQQTFQLMPDVTLELLLNTTGSLRATFFYRQNIDYLNGFSTTGSPQTRRYGTSLSYNKEFDSFSEFLFGKKKRKEAANKPATDAAKQPVTIINGSKE